NVPLSPTSKFASAPYAFVAEKVPAEGILGKVQASQVQLDSGQNLNNFLKDVVTGATITFINPGQVLGTAIISSGTATQTVEPNGFLSFTPTLAIKGALNAAPETPVLDLYGHGNPQPLLFRFRGNGNAGILGNLGIGTLSPSETLEVIGNLRTS